MRALIPEHAYTSSGARHLTESGVPRWVRIADSGSDAKIISEAFIAGAEWAIHAPPQQKGGSE